MKFRIIPFLFVVVLVASCSSTTRDYKGVYEQTVDLDDLSIPPGLSRPETSTDTTLPELQRSIKTYSRYEENVSTKPTVKYAQDYEGMRFVRNGSLFWLELDASGQEIWDDVRNFFVRLGFTIKTMQPKIGYMETDWLENQITAPTNTLATYLGYLFHSGYMDKYRIRLEWDAEKQITRLFITHQGLYEVADEEDDNIQAVTTRWVQRPPDPDLEVEMLMRFMAFRGLEIKAAEQAIEQAKPSRLTSLSEEGETTKLVINEPFARAWRHIGIAVDRLGFLVEDKNRTAGIYYIELPESFEIPKQGGVFGKLFTETQKPSHMKYLIILEDSGDVTEVNIKSNGPVPEDLKAVVNKMLKDIQGSIS